eukprot:2169415-Pyramimonas_sp.AAC.1
MPLVQPAGMCHICPGGLPNPAFKNVTDVGLERLTGKMGGAEVLKAGRQEREDVVAAAASARADGAAARPALQDAV